MTITIPATAFLEWFIPLALWGLSFIMEALFFWAASFSVYGFYQNEPEGDRLFFVVFGVLTTVIFLTILFAQLDISGLVVWT